MCQRNDVQELVVEAGVFFRIQEDIHKYIKDSKVSSSFNI